MIVVGDHGAGKRDFTNRLLAELGPGKPTLLIHGGAGHGPALDDLVQSLPGDTRVTERDEQTLAAALTDGIAEPLVVLVDAERADSGTSRLLSRLATAGTITLLATIDEEAAGQGNALRPLFDRDGALRVDLHPLTASETDQVVDEVVRRHGISDFGPAEHAWVRAMAGGVHDLVERVTLDLVDAIVNGSAVSGLAWSTPSRSTLRLATDLLAAVPPSALHDLTVVAHLGGVNLARAADLVPPTSLSMLLQRGVLRSHEGSLRIPAPLRHALLWRSESPRLETELDRIATDVARDVTHGWQVTSDEVLFAARRVGHHRLDVDPALAQPLWIVGAAILARRGEVRAAAAMAWAARAGTPPGTDLPVPALVDSLVRTGEWQQAALAAALAPDSFHPAPPSLQRLLLQSATAPCSAEVCEHGLVSRALAALDVPEADAARHVVDVHLAVRSRRYEAALAPIPATIRVDDPASVADLLESRLVAATHLGRSQEFRATLDEAVALLDSGPVTRGTPDLHDHRRARLASVTLLLCAIGAEESPSSAPLLRACLEDAFLQQDARTATMLLTAQTTLDIGLGDAGQVASRPPLLKIMPPVPEYVLWNAAELRSSTNETVRASSVASIQVVRGLLRLSEAPQDPDAALAEAQGLFDGPGRHSTPARVIAAHGAMVSGLDPQQAADWVAEDHDADLSPGRRAMLDHVLGRSGRDAGRLAAAIRTFSALGWLRRSAQALEDLVAVAAVGVDPQAPSLVRQSRLAHARALAQHDPRTSPLLTPRETEIVRLAALGGSNREIAQSNFLSVRTVESHLYHATRKLGVTSREQLSIALSRLDALPR